MPGYYHHPSTPRTKDIRSVPTINDYCLGAQQIQPFPTTTINPKSLMAVHQDIYVILSIRESRNLSLLSEVRRSSVPIGQGRIQYFVPHGQSDARILLTVSIDHQLWSFRQQSIQPHGVHIANAHKLISVARKFSLWQALWLLYGVSGKINSFPESYLVWLFVWSSYKNSVRHSYINIGPKLGMDCTHIPVIGISIFPIPSAP